MAVGYLETALPEQYPIKVYSMSLYPLFSPLGRCRLSPNFPLLFWQWCALTGVMLTLESRSCLEFPTFNLYILCFYYLYCNFCAKLLGFVVYLYLFISHSSHSIFAIATKSSVPYRFTNSSASSFVENISPVRNFP